MTWHLCPNCGRRLADGCEKQPSAHAPGCKVRRAALAQARAAERRQKKQAAV